MHTHYMATRWHTSWGAGHGHRVRIVRQQQDVLVVVYLEMHTGNCNPPKDILVQLKATVSISQGSIPWGTCGGDRAGPESSMEVT